MNPTSPGLRYFPLFIRLRGRAVVVVGGGEVAARKVELLCRAGARVTVVAPALGEALARVWRAGGVAHWAKPFEANDLAGAVLVIAATNQPMINEQVARAANQRNIPVNVVDCPAMSTFIVPSLVDRSPLLIAISSGGAAPVLARLLRGRLEAMVPTGLGVLARVAGELRLAVKQRVVGLAQRRRFWERQLNGPAMEQACRGERAQARRTLWRALHAYGDEQRPGEVYLVGAGPGDPELLTLRALRLLQQADVVVHDRLVSPEVLGLARRDARRIAVGKARNEHSWRQGQINELLVDLAHQGGRVVRLKGGDPLVFARGGEEMRHLTSRGIAVHVIPGITAAAGCAAYAGIPLTDRQCAHGCVFITGHQVAEGMNWRALAQGGQTLVVYMGLAELATLCGRLIAHGLSAGTPAALIANGTTPRQRVWTAPLRDLARVAGEAQSPALVIVGEVVGLGQAASPPLARGDDLAGWLAMAATP